MSYLFDFGISQEDPRTEQFVMNLQASDHVLSVVSGGEVPLALISMNNEIKLTAADISEPQVKLCRLKLLAAVYLEFPINGKFLGYSEFEGTCRKKIYYETIRPHLPAGDASFWDHNMAFIEKGSSMQGDLSNTLKRYDSSLTCSSAKKIFRGLFPAGPSGNKAKYFMIILLHERAFSCSLRLHFTRQYTEKEGYRSKPLCMPGKARVKSFTAGSAIFASPA